MLNSRLIFCHVAINLRYNFVTNHYYYRFFQFGTGGNAQEGQACSKCAHLSHTREPIRIKWEYELEDSPAVCRLLYVAAPAHIERNQRILYIHVDNFTNLCLIWRCAREYNILSWLPGAIIIIIQVELWLCPQSREEWNLSQNWSHVASMHVDKALTVRYLCLNGFDFIYTTVDLVCKKLSLHLSYIIGWLLWSAFLNCNFLIYQKTNDFGV